MGGRKLKKMAAGLPKIDGKALKYRDKTLVEMDVDAILERKPALVLGGRTGPHQCSRIATRTKVSGCGRASRPWH